MRGRVKERVKELWEASGGMAPIGRVVVNDIIARFNKGVMPLCRKCSKSCVQGFADADRFYCADYRGR